MAIYSLHVKPISRGAGRSVVAAAAYRAGEQIADKRLGVVWDFTRKSGVLHAEIMTPTAAPAWAHQRDVLWNAAEVAENTSTRRSTATTGRDVILALPHELSDAQRLLVVREFASELVERYGVAVDFAIHEPDRHGDQRNFHAHVLMSTRRLGAQGFGAKTRELDDRKSGPREVEFIRALWEGIANRALERAGCDERIDRRSFAERGIDQEATLHLGPAASDRDRRGQSSDLADRNRATRARNQERERLAAEREALAAQIIDLAIEREKRAEGRKLGATARTHYADRILEALTERRSTFTRGDLNRLLGKSIPNPHERTIVTDNLLSLPDVVGLKETADAEISRYTTRAVLAAEGSLMHDAKILTDRTRQGIGKRRLANLEARYAGLSGEQRGALRHAAGGDGLALVAGESGTGKSTTLAAIRDGYAADGYRVIGMAWTHVVVQNLRRDGFAEATTVAAELKRFEGRTSQWNARTVVVVDEAGMLSTKSLAALMAKARESGAKIILAGDDKQLASLERGGMFGALKQHFGAAELHEVRRVSDAEQRRAFNLMHKGEFLPALMIFAGQGAVRWSGTQDEARAALVATWAADMKAAPEKVSFVFAYTNADVALLNADLRAERRQQGLLGKDQELDTAHGRLPFAQGDRIQFTATDKRRGFFNGAAGTVLSVQSSRVTLRLENRQNSIVTFDSREFNGFRHGYAGTIYKGQGRTLDQTYLYHSHHWRSAPGYVALTRHREKTALFVAAETARDLRQLARQMARIDDIRAASQFHQQVQEPARSSFHERLLAKFRSKLESVRSQPSEPELDPHQSAALERAQRLKNMMEQRLSRSRRRDRGPRL